MTVAGEAPEQLVLNPAITVIDPVADRSRILPGGELQLNPAGSNGLWGEQNGIRNIHTLDAPTVKAGESVTVKMAGRITAGYEEAGLSLFTNQDAHVSLLRKHGEGNRTLTVMCRPRHPAGAVHPGPVPDRCVAASPA